MSVQSFNPREIAEQGLNTKEVWYVYDETIEEVLGFPSVSGEYGRITPVFLEKEDAETSKFIVSKQAYLQNHKLSVQSTIFQNLVLDIQDEPEFKLQMYDSIRAKEWLSELQDILRTREFEEKRNKELEGKTLDELYEERD